MDQLVPASPSLSREALVRPDRQGVPGRSTAGRLAGAPRSPSLPVHIVTTTLAASLLFAPACSLQLRF